MKLVKVLLALIDDLRGKSNDSNETQEKTESIVSSTRNDIDITNIPTPTITPFPTFTPVSTRSVIPSAIVSSKLDDLSSHWRDYQSLYKLKYEENMGYDAAFVYRRKIGKGGEDEYLLIDFDRNVMTSMTVYILRTGKISRCQIHSKLSASEDYSKGWKSRSLYSDNIEFYVWLAKGEDGYIQEYDENQKKVRRFEELSSISTAIRKLQECGYSVNDLAPEK